MAASTQSAEAGVAVRSRAYVSATGPWARAAPPAGSTAAPSPTRGGATGRQHRQAEPDEEERETGAAHAHDALIIRLRSAAEGVLPDVVGQRSGRGVPALLRVDQLAAAVEERRHGKRPLAFEAFRD